MALMTEEGMKCVNPPNRNTPSKTWSSPARATAIKNISEEKMICKSFIFIRPVMKKIFTTTICLLLLTVAHAQKINEKEAQQFLEKVWGYLKTSDSVSFVNLWLPEDSVWQRIHTPIGGT